MAYLPLKFKDWVFEVNQELTEKTYQLIFESGADRCDCSDCKNYVSYRDSLFPGEIRKLLSDLKIDYRKEVEIMSFGRRENGLHHIVGWFHFKGSILSEKMPGGKTGFTINFTKIAENFSISFFNGDALTFFEDKNGLVQVEFEAYIPWVINKELETA